MIPTGLFDTMDPDTEPDTDPDPDVGSVFRFAGQLITDPPKSTTQAIEDETDQSGADAPDRSSRRNQRRPVRGIARQREQSGPPTENPLKRHNPDKGFVKRLVDATGATEYAASETAEQLRRDRATARETGGVMGALTAFDAATRAGFDFLLDNPEASIQDTTRSTIAATTGVTSETQGQKAATLGQRFNAATRGLTADTPLDNPVTDAVSTGFEWLIADPAKAGLTATTGIDVDAATTEGTVGAIDAFDVGVTIGTFGVGKAGVGAAKAAVHSSDEASGLLARALNRSGPTAQVIDEGTRAVDEAVHTTDTLPVVFDEATHTTDNLPVVFDEAAHTTDNLPVVVDDAARVSNDVVDSSPWRARGTARVNEARTMLSRFGARISEEVTRLGDETAEFAKQAAKGADETTQVTDETTGVLSRITGSPAATFGVATGGVLAGGALLDALGTFDRVNVTDDQGTQYQLINEKQYQPTPTHTDGGVLWRVDQTNGSSLGYTVMVGVQGRNVYILDGNGRRMRAKVSADQFNEAIKRAQGAN